VLVFNDATELAHAFVEQFDRRHVTAHGGLEQGGIDQPGPVPENLMNLATDPGHGQWISYRVPDLRLCHPGVIGDRYERRTPGKEGLPHPEHRFRRYEPGELLIVHIEGGFPGLRYCGRERRATLGLVLFLLAGPDPLLRHLTSQTLPLQRPRFIPRLSSGRSHKIRIPSTRSLDTSSLMWYTIA